MVWPGEIKAWDALSGLDSADVTVNAKVLFTAHDSTYVLTCFGQDIFVSLNDRNIYSTTALGKLLINEHSEYSRLSILKYLIHSTDLPLAGQLIRPSDLPGGDIFIRGTHVLPLDKVSEYFENNSNEFISIGKRLGGTQLEYGDMSIELLPFPRAPVVIIVWSGDEEFPARSTLLIDSSCKSQIPTDIIWSTAMMSIKMMLTKIGRYFGIQGSQ